MVMNAKRSSLWAGVVALLACNGCMAPHYTRCQVVVPGCGQAAPALAGPRDPALEKHLSSKRAAEVNLLAVVTGFFTTPLKCLGFQGWRDYGWHADALGKVVKHQLSSD